MAEEYSLGYAALPTSTALLFQKVIYYLGLLSSFLKVIDVGSYPNLNSVAIFGISKT